MKKNQISSFSRKRLNASAIPALARFSKQDFSGCGRLRGADAVPIETVSESEFPDIWGKYREFRAFWRQI